MGTLASRSIAPSPKGVHPPSFSTPDVPCISETLVEGVVNLKSRVYSTRSVGGQVQAVDENFYYQGDARDLTEALRKLAAIKADERRLILLPGRGKVKPFSGNAAVP